MTPGSGAEGRVLAAGSAGGEALLLDEPLSFWGGIEPATGEIIDAHHPQRGEVVTGRVLCMPGGRGSSSSSSVLAEAIRRGTAPAGIVLAEPDAILAVGAVAAAELYGTEMPVVTLDPAAYASIRTGDGIRVGPGGAVTRRGRPAAPR